MSYDRDRYDRDRYDRDRYERDRSESDRQDRDRYGRYDRGPIDRASDEVRSWFGDDDAQRRRERDERENERWNREERWRGTVGSEAERPRERYREYGYSRGSQEFGPEGYGAPVRYSTPQTTGREWRSREWQWSERWRVPGPYVGRGPRGYQRSEERIREEINDRLTAHGLVDATDITVQLQNGEATLTGFVDSREAKRAAEDCVEDVQGVREVHNHLRIRSHADDAGVGRTSVLGLTEHDMQTASTARQADAASRSRTRNP